MDYKSSHVPLFHFGKEKVEAKMRQTMISRTPVEDKFYRLAEKAIELDFDREKRHEEKVA